MVGRSAQKVYDQVKASAAPDTPIIWSEYNATYMSQPEVTDSAFMGPWLANNIRECDGLQTLMSYWSFSDVFEEQGVVKTPFYGGYGLIAERHLPKASFWVFDLLHGLGEQRILLQSENALVTKHPDGGVSIALWNYAEPGETIPPKTFQIKTAGFKARAYRMRYVGPGHGSVLEHWQKSGAPSLPTMAQLKTLLENAGPPPVESFPIDRPIVLQAQTLAELDLIP
jgi:xylan 1,4-beta-xylosidase